MKIAFLLTQLEVGGAQTRVFETAAELRKRGHEATVVFLYEKRPCFSDLPKVVLHPGKRPKPHELPGLLLKLHNFLKFGDFDALVTNTAPANILGCSIGRLAGLDTRVAVQTQPPQRLSKALGMVDRLAGSLGMYTVNIANSDWTRSCFVGYGEPYLKHMTIVKDGISPPLSDLSPAEARLKLGLKQDDFVVANVGRLSKQKDHATLIEAMRNVPGRLLIAGEGELRADLEHQIANAGLSDRVTLLGEIPRSRVGLLFRAADVFAFSSKWETFGLALVEAAASGLPLVATDLDVSREVLGRDERSAMFVTPGDAKGFAAALNTVRTDLFRREELSRRSLETANRFTIELHADRLMEVVAPGASVKAAGRAKAA